MEKNCRIIITRVGGGYEIEPMPGPGTGDTDHVKIFRTKKQMLRFIEFHYIEKRIKHDAHGGHEDVANMPPPQENG
jgi:hypothetical protein